MNLVNAVHEATERFAEAETAAFFLLARFHEATDCGQPEHRPECQRLVESFGWVSWDPWRYIVTHSELGS